mgnify:CR=1 FL=1
MQRLIMDMPLMISGARWAAADHHGKAEVNRFTLGPCMTSKGREEPVALAGRSRWEHGAAHVF